MNRPHISVIIPSALRTVPGSAQLWLERAIPSVAAQTLLPQEIIVGLDPGVAPPEGISALAAGPVPVRIAHGQQKGHQAACNAAAAKAESPLLAILEDDDTWAPNHLETLVAVMDEIGADFVSSSQLEVNPDGTSRGIVFDFPTASGWLMKRLVWMRLGGFDPRWTIHHDNEFLARLNAARLLRAHVIEETADLAARPRLALIARHAQIARVAGLRESTVRRTVHAASIMGGMGANPEKVLRSAKEYSACEILYGSLEATW